MTRENLGDGGLLLGVGEQLRRLRVERGLSLRDVGKLVGDDLSWQGLARIERGERFPNMRTLVALSGALGVRFVADAGGVRLEDGA